MRVSNVLAEIGDLVEAMVGLRASLPFAVEAVGAVVTVELLL